MAITLPLPVRIAAGVLATGLDRLRHLPQDLPSLPVTVAGQAVRASMRVQQEIAQLAGRGDELLSGITSRPTEHPAWARFDDEDGDAGTLQDRTVDAADPAPHGSPSERAGSDGPTDRATPDSTAPERSTPRRRAPAPRRPRGRSSAQASRATRSRAVEPSAEPVPSTAAARIDVRPDPADPAPADLADMPGYDGLRLAQVRARLRGLDAAAVARLLEHEQAGAARAPFLTLLANRLTTLRAGHQRDPQA